MNDMNGQEEIRAFLEREGVSQAKLAKMANVSQPTVSRALSLEALRPSPARSRLFTFIQERAIIAPMPDPALRAVKEVWDGSTEHAMALAKLVRASRELWPKLAKE